MFILGNFIMALALAIHYILYIYMWIMIIRVVISWVNPDPYNPIVNFIYRATEPVLSYVRRIIPPISGIDLSPIIVFIFIYFVDTFLVGSLQEIGLRLKTTGTI